MPVPGILVACSTDDTDGCGRGVGVCATKGQRIPVDGEFSRVPSARNRSEISKLRSTNAQEEPVGSLARGGACRCDFGLRRGRFQSRIREPVAPLRLQNAGAQCDMVVRPLRTMKTVAVVRQRKCEQRHFATGRGDGLAQPPEPQTRRCCDRIEHPCPITQCAQAVSGSGHGRPMSTRAMTLCGGVRFRLTSRYAAISLPAVRPPPDRMPRGLVFVLSRARVW